MGEDTYIAVGEGTNRLETFEKPRKFDPMRFALDVTQRRSSLTEKEDETEEKTENRRLSWTREYT